MLHVCLAFHDATGVYYRYAATTLYSVAVHSASPLCAHIIHDATLGPGARRALERLARSCGVELAFHDMQPVLAAYAAIATNWRYGVGSLFRFCLPRCIPDTEVLYLDCDIIALMDVATVFAAGQTRPDYLVGCVPDRGADYTAEVKAHVRRLGLEPKSYFNSGVLLLHTGRIAAVVPDFARACLNICARNPGTDFADQDALNLFFARLPRLWLPESCNTFMDFLPWLMLEEEQLRGRILHYTGTKPWVDTRFPSSRVFARYHAEALARMGEQGGCVLGG